MVSGWDDGVSVRRLVLLVRSLDSICRGGVQGNAGGLHAVVAPEGVLQNLRPLAR